MGTASLDLNGFVVVHRAIFDSWLWHIEHSHFKVALTCLMLANWREQQWFDGRTRRTIARGEFVTSQQHLAAHAHVTLKQVRRALDVLRRGGFLETEAGRASNFTLIRLVNYAIYQDIPEDKGEQRASKGRAKGEQRATTEQGNKGTRSIEGQNSQTYPQQQADLFGGADPAPAAVNGSHSAAVTRRCVEYLNRKAGRRLGDQPYRDLVRKVLDAGHTEREINLVFWWAAEYEWPKGAEDRSKRLHPNCLLPMRKSGGWRAFEQYLDLAREKYHEVKKQEFNPHDRSDADAT